MVAMGTARHGHATVVLECHDHCKESEYGAVEVVTLKHSYPLKVLVPEHTGNPKCKWIFPIVFGGGLVGGDNVEIIIETKPNTCGLLTSQESTKVYHCEDDLLTTQKMNYIIGDNSLLCVLPDYCVCYKDANFLQTQNVQMTESGNIILLDWMTCGRSALKEQWLFKSYKNSIQIDVGSNTVYKDSIHIHDVPGLKMKSSMKNYQVPNIDWECYFYAPAVGESVKTDVICTVSTLQKGGMSGLYLRFLAINTAQAYTVIKEIVDPLLPLLGADPFQNKYG
ncbi:ureD [Mytilus coruscus]|uniref:UreD n=1 Tax=Mytilus coruscus TaxID=42192 RepID=A0A6J8EHM8_MYTCO|nr:ureD [Mytilus coruscus]